MSPININPANENIRKLLISGKQFVIPRFQREYSWEKRNFQEFLDDVLNGLTISSGTINTSPYFVGTMLFVGNFTDSTKNEIQVVDGQQRLTTITILFSAISDIFKSLNQDDLSKLIFKFIMTVDDNGAPIKIIKTKSSYPFFQFFIQDRDKSNREDPSSEEEANIKSTYDYFISRLKESALKKYLKEKRSADVDSINYIDLLKAIRDQVLGCTFVSISSDDIRQANRIFEILNAKGKQLQFVDLVKNKLFEILDDTEPADYAEEKWNTIKNNLEATEMNSVGMATFLRQYWASKYSITSTKQMYTAFKEQIPENKDAYKNFIADLAKESKCYSSILNPKRENYNNKKEYFWLVQSLDLLSNKFDIAQVRVALLPLLIFKERKTIDMALLKKTILFLENFHFTYTAIMSYPSNKLDSIYSKFAIAFRKCTTKEECRKIIENELISKLRGLLPTAEQFKERTVLLTYSKKPSPYNVRAKYLINKLNSYFSKNELFEDNSSIEHILPEDRGTESLNIGNLIALEISLNEKASNKDYSDKIKEYNKSKYPWVLKFITKHSTWSVSDIESRAAHMANLYFEKILSK